MIDTEYINTLIKTEDVDGLAAYMKKYKLRLSADNKIIGDADVVAESYAYWDKRQLVRKILLNSALIPSALV